MQILYSKVSVIIRYKIKFEKIVFLVCDMSSYRVKREQIFHWGEWLACWESCGGRESAGGGMACLLGEFGRLDFSIEEAARLKGESHFANRLFAFF